jgi:hypothetical protein
MYLFKDIHINYKPFWDKNCRQHSHAQMTTFNMYNVASSNNTEFMSSIENILPNKMHEFNVTYTYNYN